MIDIIRLDIRDACRGLARHPLRSFLSSLGIGIGVSALIAMLSISEGARKTALDKIHSLGTSTLRVESVLPLNAASLTRMEPLLNLSQGLLQSDIDIISSWLGSRGLAGGYGRRDDILLHGEGGQARATLVGADGNWFAVERLQVEDGRLLDRQDVAAASSYCVIGPNLARKLGATTASKIRFDTAIVTVVGVLKSRDRLLTEGTGLSSMDFDNALFLPLTGLPGRRIIAGRTLLDGMVVSLTSRRELEILGLGDQLFSLLLSLHRGVEDFRLVTPLSLLKEARESQRTFTVIMGAIAGLSLFVGGIGVMNVMLANIAEQTREIGLRMAVGASKARIVSLYLWTAILLCLAGGFLGIILGLLLALLIQYYAGWPVQVSLFALLTAPLCTLLTGVVFGLHPAVRAASLDPARALRDS